MTLQRLQVLCFLMRGRSYAHEILKNIPGLSAGTLYPIFAYGLRQGFITEEEEQGDNLGRRRRIYYTLTEPGRIHVNAELRILDSLRNQPSP